MLLKISPLLQRLIPNSSKVPGISIPPTLSMFRQEENAFVDIFSRYFHTPKSSPPHLEIVTVKKLIEDPIRSHRLLSDRLKAQGLLAPFPEFAPAVHYLEDALRKVRCDGLQQNDVRLIVWELKTLKFTFNQPQKNYPYQPPYIGKYPYIPTLNAIKRCLEFFDGVTRKTYQNVYPLYHTDRYLYHYNQVYNPDFIYYPTIKTLKLSDFVATRATPIGFLGVNVGTVFADGYYLSPLELFIHDINHARRIKDYFDRYLKAHSTANKDKMYKDFQSTIDKILDHTKIDQKHGEEKYIRLIMMVLYFELFHDYGFTPDEDSIKSAFLLKPGGPSPFEYMAESTYNPKTSKLPKLENNNIASGLSLWEKRRKTPVIRYFFNQGPNFLASAYNKCINGYYDSHYQRDKEALPPFEMRSKKLFFLAAKRILKLHGLEGIISDMTLWKRLDIVEPIEKYPNRSLNKPINNEPIRKFTQDL